MTTPEVRKRADTYMAQRSLTLDSCLGVGTQGSVFVFNILSQLKEHRRRWELEHPEPRSESDWHQYAREITQCTERWLDEGYGACHFRNPTNARVLVNALRHYQDKTCRVSSLVVMPNHAHVVMKPYSGHKLEDVLKVMKGFVSHKVNEARQASGNIWEQESYDRIIRDEEHLYRVVQYIGRNGLLAGLSRNEYVRWMHPEWIDCGWDFETT